MATPVGPRAPTKLIAHRAHRAVRRPFSPSIKDDTPSSQGWLLGVSSLIDGPVDFRESFNKVN
jgi:hypothetical protein